MIDETLLKSNFLGRDGFTWWIGKVADPKVWKAEHVIMSQKNSTGHRCKVRIIGYHPFSNELEENDLPWAQIMMDPVTGSGQGAMGDALTLQGGESCLGFFLDGEEAQQPVIMGLLGRPNGVKNSISPEELSSNKSSDFRNFGVGNDGQLPTKSTPNETENVSPPSSPPVKGKLKDAFFTTDLGLNTGVDGSTEIPKLSIGTGVGQCEQGVYTFNGGCSPAAQNVEAAATKVQENPSNCGSDAIGRITQVITDFIALTNGLESSLGKFVDPLRNEIIDMDAELKRIVRQVKGLVKSVLNNLRNGIIGKLNVIFSTFLGKLNLVNPLDFISDEGARKAFQKIVDIIFCLFEKLIGNLTGFLKNMFQTLVENIVNGPTCATEQFVSGIFAKVFRALEDLLTPVLDGLDWLTGGIGQVQGFLRKASNLASAIFSFIGCDGRKCTTPSKWVSTLNGSLVQATDDWQKQISNINILEGVSSDLTRIQDEATKDIGDWFGSDEFKDNDYNGMKIRDILSATDKITGGDSAGALDRGLGSIESAISTTSLFGKNTIFDACTEKINNPTSQIDLIGMPIGFEFDKCIAPEIQITGSGTGATAIPIVNSSKRIIATQITNPGSGYDSFTSASVIDNTNKGSGASLKVLIKDGKVDKIVVLNSGRGYCPNSAPIVKNPVGIITGIYIDKPGIGYTDGDTIIIPLPPGSGGGDGGGGGGGGGITPGDPPGDGGGTNPPGIVINPTPTPGNGSIIIVPLPQILPDPEYDFIPEPIINTKTGRGAKLIPILSYKDMGIVDKTPDRSGLVGITSVIDCIGSSPTPDSPVSNFTTPSSNPSDPNPPSSGSSSPSSY